MDAEKTAKLIKMTKRLFNQTTAADILKWDERQKGFRVAGKLLPPEESALLITDAHMIKNSLLWDYLIKDMQWEANKRLYLEAKTTEDMIFPRAILWNLDILDKKVDNLGKLSV